MILFFGGERVKRGEQMPRFVGVVFFFSFSFVVSRIWGGFVVVISFQNLVNTNPFLMADFGFNVMQ